jgi:hypothetical protein
MRWSVEVGVMVVDDSEVREDESDILNTSGQDSAERSEVQVSGEVDE